MNSESFILSNLNKLRAQKFLRYNEEKTKIQL